MPKEVILLVIPLIIVQLSLQVVALINVSRKGPSELRFENKLVWVLIIIFGQLLGSIIYFIIGGNPNGNDRSED